MIRFGPPEIFFRVCFETFDKRCEDMIYFSLGMWIDKEDML